MGLFVESKTPDQREIERLRGIVKKQRAQLYESEEKMLEIQQNLKGMIHRIRRRNQRDESQS